MHGLFSVMDGFTPEQLFHACLISDGDNCSWHFTAPT